MFSLWAIQMTDAPLNSSSISFWIVYSVTTSIFAVASSSITMRFWRRIALMMQISWRSPTLKFFPSALTWNFRPLPAMSWSSTFSSVVVPSSVYSSERPYSFIFNTLFFASSSSNFDLPLRIYSRPAFLISSEIRASLNSLNGSRFDLRVPANITGSYGIIVI